MARIRTIKPEYWGHPKTMRVSRDARLLFLGLLNESDDAGRQLGSAKRIAGAIFPHDADVDADVVARWLAELDGVGLIHQYCVDGVAYLCIPGFATHQKVSHPTPSRLPGPTAARLQSDSGEIPERLPNNSGASPEVLRSDSGVSLDQFLPDLGSRKGHRLRSDSGEIPERPSPTSPNGDAPPGHVRELVAHYVEQYRASHHGYDPPSSLRSACGQQVKRLLERDHVDPCDLRLCLNAIAAENKQPANLPLVLADLHRVTP